MMRILVLGAGGFVGQRIIAALAAGRAAGGVTTPIAALRRPLAGIDGDSVDHVVLDATDTFALRAALDGVDAVVNCVAGSTAAIRDSARALAAAAGHRRIIHLSSMTVYGTATGLVAEDAPLLGDLGTYGAAKVDAERMLSTGNTVMLRPGCVYGPTSPLWTTRIAGLLAQGRIGDLGPAGTGISNLVDVEDVARAVMAALSLPAPGAFNLALRDCPSWNGYFQALARALDLPCPAIPAWRLWAERWLLAPPIKLVELAGLGAPPLMSPSQLALWQQNIRMDVSAAESQLGLTWTPLSDTLARSAAWWRMRHRPGTQATPAAPPAA